MHIMHILGLGLAHIYISNCPLLWRKKSNNKNKTRQTKQTKQLQQNMDITYEWWKLMPEKWKLVWITSWPWTLHWSPGGTMMITRSMKFPEIHNLLHDDQLTIKIHWIHVVWKPWLLNEWPWMTPDIVIHDI